MASLLASLLIKLGLDSAEFKSGLTVAEKDLKKATREIEKIGKSMVGTGQKLTAAVTLPMLAIGGLAVKGALDQRKAVAQVEAAITSMGNAAGRSAEQLAKNADALEMNSLYDADVILTKVTANLLTFGNVAGDVFDRAQQAAIDMATRMGSDPQAAAIMLGKALNDPIQGITALSRVGVQLSESQKAQIKSFVKVGEVAKAQGIILAEVERQFKGAAQAAADTSPWRKATVAIGQAGDAFGEALLPIIPVVTDLVVRVAQAFANLSPTMQNVVLIGGAVAAAFGPILIGVGNLTIALASRLAPALVAFRSALVATAAAEGTAAAATTALTVALRALMIATGVGAAIVALGAAYYILTGRTKETTAAQRAAELQAIRTGAAADIERKASEELAVAQGRERAAALEAMKASRARAAQSLQTARAKIADARASIALAKADSNRRIQAAVASSRGAGGGIDPAMVEINRRSRVIDPAAEKLADAEEKYAKAMGDLDGLNNAIEKAERPITLPPINTANIDAGTNAVGRVGKAAQDAKASAGELQSVLDRLFPEVEKKRTFEAELKMLEQAKMTEEARAAAVRALRREYLGLHRDLIATGPDGEETKVSIVVGEDPIPKMLETLPERAAKALGAVKDSAEAMRVQVIQSFTQMIDGAIGQLDRFVNGIKSGNWLDAILGLLGAIDGIASAFTGGKGFKIGGLTIGNGSGIIPGYATGTDFHPGGLAVVGERGPELLNLPRGSQVMSNRELSELGAGGREMTVRVVKGDLFDAIVEQRAAGVVASQAPAIARAGSSMALSKLSRMQAKALG